MNLIEKLQQCKINAMKRKDTERKSVLSYIIAEIKRQADSKDPSDENCIKTIQKQIQSNKDVMINIENIDTRFSDKEKLISENNILSEFLPEELSEEEIKNIIQDNLNEKSSIGQMMGLIQKYAKENGKILNGKKASYIVKSELS